MSHIFAGKVEIHQLGAIGGDSDQDIDHACGQLLA